MTASGSGATAGLSAGERVAADLDSIRRGVESIGTWNSVMVYRSLRRAIRRRAEVEEEANALYGDFQRRMSAFPTYLPAIMLPALVAIGAQVTRQLVDLVQQSQIAGGSILSVLRVQQASQALGAVIERKYAYAFGFISLYVALVSTILSLGVLPGLSGREGRQGEVSQTFFRADHSLQFAPGKAEVKDAGDLCNLKRQLAAAGSTVAIVLGRHDQTPLGHSARLRFSTNAGLAQQRAETVARILETTSECGQAIPTVIRLVAAPRNVGEGVKPPKELQEDREVIVYGLKRVLMGRTTH